MNKIAFFDTEAYPNYWLLKCKIDNNFYDVEIVNNEPLVRIKVEFINSVFQKYTCVSFNGINYDIPMIIGALHGFNNKQLKQLNDKIIVDGLKHWELNLPEWKPKDHIDIMEVAPGKAGLKQYAARIHSKTIQDLPYDPGKELTDIEMKEVNKYCSNDINLLENLYNALQPQLEQRKKLSDRYGIDLRSKSDAQLAEAVLKKKCEDALCKKIYKPNIDWNMQIKYEIPSFISYNFPQLIKIFNIIKESIFTLDNNGSIKMPDKLEGLEIIIGTTSYKLGIGGLHSQEKKSIHLSNDEYLLIDNDVASYYPSLILNSGKYPEALGSTFLKEYKSIIDERLKCKAKQKELKGKEEIEEYKEAECGNEGGKIMINGCYGKTGSYYSVLFAPQMLLQTTLTGQLSLLMLIEMMETSNISVISANTDGIIIKCKRDMIDRSREIIKSWETITNLQMEHCEYKSIYSRDVNNYFAVKMNGEVKRKGEYSKSGLIVKKNPDCEICSDAVGYFLAKGIPIEFTIRMCFDIRKFLVVQKVNGGAIKLWGEGANKNARISDIVPILQKNGWVKAEGRKWRLGCILADVHSAYKMCFSEQRKEYLGKVVRWYYGTQSPGTIVYASNGNTVSLSEGSTPCMTLPDTFPQDIDYDWYLRKAESILEDIGYNILDT